MDKHAEEKRTEQSLIVRSGKSEAEVTNNERRRSRYRTAEADTKHRAACLRQQSYLCLYTDGTSLFSDDHVTDSVYMH